MTRRPRVLIVDDSAFARTLLARVLTATGRIEVVATARDGTDALEKIDELDPDVVTLDLTMPGLDGIGVLQALAGRVRPRVIVVSMSSVDTELGAMALTLGAIDLVAKPTALASDRLGEIGAELTAKILATTASPTEPTPHAPAAAAALATGIELVVLGTSTGGPQALTQVVAALPADLGAPVCIVLHIPIGYTEALAARLDRISALAVTEARAGVELRPGMVVIARAGSHLRIHRHGSQLITEVSPLPSASFVPSVDELFRSAAAAAGIRCLGVVLTGMGDDGLEGARAIANAGGTLVTEHPSTCVVYGMPRVIDEARLGATSVPLTSIAAEITARCKP